MVLCGFGDGIWVVEADYCRNRGRAFGIASIPTTHNVKIVVSGTVLNGLGRNNGSGIGVFDWDNIEALGARESLVNIVNVI